MARRPTTTLVTPRDLDILTALDRCPLTLDQLLSLSQTFSRPFTIYRRAHERLQQLSDSGWVRRAQHAIPARREAVENQNVHVVQSSSCSPGTCRKSRRLRLNRVESVVSAMAAIRKSSVPSLRHCLRSDVKHS